MQLLTLVLIRTLTSPSQGRPLTATALAVQARSSHTRCERFTREARSSLCATLLLQSTMGNALGYSDVRLPLAFSRSD